MTKHDPSTADPVVTGNKVSSAAHVHICSFTTHRDVQIQVEGQWFRFEFSAHFGPFLLGKRGHLLKNQQPTARFLEAVTYWWQQGGKLDGRTAIWAEPEQKPLYHLGRNNYTEDIGLAQRCGCCMECRTILCRCVPPRA